MVTDSSFGLPSRVHFSSVSVGGFMSEEDPGPPGSLSAVIMGEQYVTQCRVY